MNKGLVFIFGAAAGAAAGLLLSPNSGEKNRELVAEKAEYYTANSGEAFQRVADTVRTRVRDAGEDVKPAADEVRVKINEARDRIAEQITRNRAVQDVEADVADVASDIADAAAEAGDDAAE